MMYCFNARVINDSIAKAPSLISLPALPLAGFAAIIIIAIVLVNFNVIIVIINSISNSYKTQKYHPAAMGVELRRRGIKAQ